MIFKKYAAIVPGEVNLWYAFLIPGSQRQSLCICDVYVLFLKAGT